MPIIAVEVLIKLGIWIFEWLLNKKANNEALLEAFKKFSELARTENIKTIQDRAKAEEQIKQANDKWDAIEASKK